MEFVDQKQLVIDQLSKVGLKPEVAKRAGVTQECVRQTFKKCCLSEMTTVQLKVWTVAMEIVTEQHARFDIIEQETKKLAKLAKKR
jgi:hypothetical protein